jgi:transcriptional regulator with XRE-family HTH domain
MATTLATVEAREVLRCEHCSLVQFRTQHSLCRRCHKALEREEAEAAIPALSPAPVTVPEPAPINVARSVRELRRLRNLSQRQLALRMQVPRTYISKIENGKAIPTLHSLERLARALEARVGQLVHDGRSRREDMVRALTLDAFCRELIPHVAQLNSYHRSLFLNQVRDMAAGRKRPMLVS